MSETESVQVEKTKVECGWVKLWTPSGAHVTLPVTMEPMDYKAMLDNVGRMLDAGFLVNPVGLESGEHKALVGWVVRKSKSEKDGSETPLVDLYEADEAKKYPILSVYLNNADEVKAFEHASGLTLEKMPSYVGNDKIERGKGPKTDNFLCRPSKPFTVVFVDNPAWKKEDADAAAKAQEMYKVPKRKFARWLDQKPAQTATSGGPAQGKTPIEKVKEWADWLSKDPTIEELNAAVKNIRSYDDDTAKSVWNLVKEHAKKCCAAWDVQRKGYVQLDPQSYAEHERTKKGG